MEGNPQIIYPYRILHEINHPLLSVSSWQPPRALQSQPWQFQVPGKKTTAVVKLCGQMGCGHLSPRNKNTMGIYVYIYIYLFK